MSHKALFEAGEDQPGGHLAPGPVQVRYVGLVAMSEATSFKL